MPSKRFYGFFLVNSTVLMARLPHDPEFGISVSRNSESRRLIEKFLKVSAEVNSQDCPEDRAKDEIAEQTPPRKRGPITKPSDTANT